MSWKLVNKEYTGPDAAGATEDSSYDLGYMFYNQSKEIVFRVGNTGNKTADYIITASGENSSLLDGVEFSKDRNTWEEEILFSGVEPNYISDTAYCRFTASGESYITSGTFLIAITETERDA